MIGQCDTSGDVFDSLPLTGLMIATDENMVPFSQRQFSPLVRGIARSSARVEIKQNGYSIYTTTVPPGPFETNTITEAQDGDDLEVIVWEADGKPQFFTVPYQKPAIALHRGFIKYSVMSGHYHPADFHSQDEVTQATLMVGLPWNLTLFGGGQGSRSYQSGAMGVGLSLAAFGSVSVDGTQAQRHMINLGSQLGNKWRLRYSNTFAATHTQISASVSQYSARFSELAEVLNSYGNRADGMWQQHYRQHKSSQILQLSQSVGTWGAFSASLQHDQWQNQRSSNNYRLSWSQSFRRFSLSSTAELLQSEGHAIPSQGSVIEIRFKIRVGARAILTITTAQGESLPLGAQFYLSDQQGSVGMVGDSGEAYVSGLAPQGIVKVESPNRNFVIHYKLRIVCQLQVSTLCL